MLSDLCMGVFNCVWVGQFKRPVRKEALTETFAATHGVQQVSRPGLTSQTPTLDLLLATSVPPSQTSMPSKGLGQGLGSGWV